MFTTKFDLTKSMGRWIDILNNNLKWGIALFIRSCSVVITMLAIHLFLQYAGIIKGCNDILTVNGFKIKPAVPSQVSKPAQSSNENDIKDIENVLNIMKGKK